MTPDEIDRIVKVMRRQTMVWGAMVALLVASIVVSVVRIIDRPQQQVAIVFCTHQGLSVKCGQSR